MVFYILMAFYFSDDYGGGTLVLAGCVELPP
jgi:hypothetical protein